MPDFHRDVLKGIDAFRRIVSEIEVAANHRPIKVLSP